MGYDNWTDKQKALAKKRLAEIDKNKENYKEKLKKRIENVEKNGLVDKNFAAGCKSCQGIPNEPDCLIGPYKDIEKGCNGDAHHVRPDGMGRLVSKKDEKAIGSKARLSGAGSHDDGIAICIHPIAHKETHSFIAIGWRGVRGKDGMADPDKAVAETEDALRKQGGQKKKGDKKTSPSKACIEKAIEESIIADQKRGFYKNKKVRATTGKLPDSTLKSFGIP